MNTRNNPSGTAAGGPPSRSLRPGQDLAVHGNINDVQELGVSELPRAMLASGIPRIVIMDENAVYDHYMRRLNRVWMRRIQASRKKAKVDSNRWPRSPEYKKADFRPSVVPAFVHGMDEPDRVRRHRGRPPSDAVDPGVNQSSARESVRAGHRPRSAPIFVSAPTAAWAGMMDRKHAATGPGPTSSRHRHYHGDDHVTRREHGAVRPDSAPNLRHSSRDRNMAPLCRKRSRPNKQPVPAWIAPRLTRLEGETHDLIEVCRKAARSKGDATLRCNSRQGRATGELPRPGDDRHRKRPDLANAMMPRSSTDLRPEEKIEDLGRGAVVRLIGSLGMGRYAHRFRAFAVTGSDLASCKEEDLIQIGVSFRPHRIRLLREIKRRRGRRRSTDIACQETSRVASSDSWEAEAPGLQPVPTTNEEDASSFQHHNYGKRGPAAHSVREHLSDTSSKNSNSNKGTPKTLRRSCSGQSLCSGDALESSSASTMCTAFEHGNDRRSTPRRAQETSQAAQASTSIETEACMSSNHRLSSARAGEGSTDVETLASEHGDGRGISFQTVDGNAGYSVGGDNNPTAGNSSQNFSASAGRTLDVRSGSSAEPAERGHITPRMKGTLQVSGVKAGNVRVALGGKDRFVRVKTCDQLRRTGSVQDKGPGALLNGTVLSFSVTDKDLAAGGIHVELCDGGTVDAPNPVASGTIPGDLTLQLICRSRSNCETSSDNGERSPTKPFGSGVAVEVRLFAKMGGEDAGVCTLNLKFSPDVEGPTRTSDDSDSPRGPSVAEGLTRGASEARKPEVVTSDGKEERQPSWLLLEETARHVGAIEEVCDRVRRQRESVDNLDSQEHGRHRLTTGEHLPTAMDQREIVRDTPPPFEGRRFSVEQQRDAVIVLQSHTRRRAAENIVKRRVKERIAANRVQAFARQRMAFTQVRRARELELEAMRQQNRAAVKLQSTARCRLAVKTAQRRRSEAEEIAAETHNTAAVQIQGVVRHHAKKREVHRAATTLQGMAKVHDARVEAGRRKTERLEVARRNSEEAAASQIQAFTRHQRRDHVQRVAQDAEERCRAAIKVQSVARCRSAKREVTLIREGNQAVCAVARAMVEAVWTQAFERHMAMLATESRRAAAKLQKIQNERAAATATAAQFVVDEAETQMCHAVAQTRQALARKRPSSSVEVKTATQETFVDADGEVDEDECRALIELQSTAGEFTAMEESGSRQHTAVAESLQLAEAAEAPVKEHEGADRIQRLCRQHQEEKGELPRQTKVAADDERQLGEATCIQSFVRQQVDAGSTGNLENRVDQLESVEGTGAEQGGSLGEAVRHSDKEKYRAAAKVQRLARRRQRAVEHRARLVSQTVVPAMCTSLVTQELLDSRKEEDAAVCIQNAFREWCLVRQAVLLQERIWMESKRQEAAECIQRGVRVFWAKKMVAALRRQEDLEMQEYVQCVQRGFRVSQANKKVATLRRQIKGENEDMLRQNAAALALEREAAATRIQQAARVSQAVERRGALKRQRDIEIECQLKLKLEKNEAVRVEAASCIQRAMRRHLAVNRVTILRRQQKMDIQRALNLESEEREAVECIQRSVRRKQAGERFTTLRRQRDSDTQRTIEETERKNKQENRRRDAAECIQRAVRCRHALAYVDALRLKRDSDIRHKEEHDKSLKARRRRAVECIQRAVRCRQAFARVEALRLRRASDIRQKEENEKRLEARRRRAAECIQRAARGRQAVARVNILIAKRDRDIRHKEEHDKHLEACRRSAAECIQQVIRCSQAFTRVDALRAKRDRDIRCKDEEEADEEQRAAATCIQCAVRSHHAAECVFSLRRQREVEVQRKVEEDSTLARYDAAACIQRSARRKQSNERVNSLRKRRDGVERKLKEEHDARTAARRDAAECIQRAARCKQACERVSAMKRESASICRRQQEVELERQTVTQREAAECIQRAVRIAQAVKRANAKKALRRRKIQHKLELEQEMQTAMRREAVQRIQRVVRVHQAVSLVSTLRRQRDIDILEQEKRTAVQHEAAAVVLQRCQRQRAAVGRVKYLRQEQARQELERQEEADRDSVSVKFAKMMEAARQGANPTTPMESAAEEQAAPAIGTSGTNVQEGGGGGGGGEVRDADEGPAQGGNGEGNWEVVAANNVGGDAFEGSEPPTGGGEEGRSGDSHSEEARETSSESGTESSELSSKSRGEPELSESLESVEREAGATLKTGGGNSEIRRQDHLRMVPSNDKRQAQESTLDIPSNHVEQQATDAGDEQTVDTASTRQNEDEQEKPSTSAAVDPARDDGGAMKNDQSYNEVGPSSVPRFEAGNAADELYSAATTAAGLVSAEPWHDLSTFESETNTVIPELSRGDGVVKGWETHVDDVTGRVYYFHPETQTTSWEPPKADMKGEQATQERDARRVEHVIDGGSSSGSAVYVDSSTAAEEADRGSRPSQEEVESSRTRQDLGGGVSVGAEEVTEPRHGTLDVQPPVLHLEAPQASGVEEKEDSAPRGGDADNDTGQASGLGDRALLNVAEGVTMTGDGGAQGEWQEIVDPVSGSKYFCNSATRETAWDLPEGAVKVAAAAAASHTVGESFDNGPGLGPGIYRADSPLSLGSVLQYPGATAELELDYS